jgi:ring-1,2-phenylacetyl-CoA epoxidase subunit PaaC
VKGNQKNEQRIWQLLKAVDELWKYTGELFEAADYELLATEEGAGADVSELKEPWMNRVKEIFGEATVPVPEKIFMQTGGKQGKHTEHIGYIMAELQYMQRAYPGCEW